MSPIWLLVGITAIAGVGGTGLGGELLPESILMWKSKLPAALVILGILTGLIIIYV